MLPLPPLVLLVVARTTLEAPDRNRNSRESVHIRIRAAGDANDDDDRLLALILRVQLLGVKTAWLFGFECSRDDVRLDSILASAAVLLLLL